MHFNNKKVYEIHNRQKAFDGFTIVELLIVIVVIGILVAIAMIAYTGIQGRARDAERTQDFNSTATALEMYYVINNKYPGLSQMTCFTPAGVQETNVAIKNPYEDFIKVNLSLPYNIVINGSNNTFSTADCRHYGYLPACISSSSVNPVDGGSTLGGADGSYRYCAMKKDAGAASGWSACYDSTVDACTVYYLSATYEGSLPTNARVISGKWGMFFGGNRS